MSLEFTMKNENEFIVHLKNVEKELATEFLNDWADATLFEAKRLLREGKIENSKDEFGGGAFDRGGLVKSGVVVISGEKERLVKFGGRLAPYAKYIERGRPAGSMPPVDVLQQWARRKKIKNWKSVGWAIAKAIEKNGQPPKPFLRQATLSIQVKLKEIYRKTVDRLSL